MGVVSFARAEGLPPLVGVPTEPNRSCPTRHKDQWRTPNGTIGKKALPGTPSLSHCKFILAIQTLLLRLVVAACEACGCLPARRAHHAASSHASFADVGMETKQSAKVRRRSHRLRKVFARWRRGRCSILIHTVEFWRRRGISHT